MWKGILVLFAALAVAGAATAADLTVTVRTADGRPVRDAVVTIVSPARPAGPIRFNWPYRMAQKDVAFDPFVLVVPVGAQVSFPNLDRVRHHVYSFSPGARFELKLYGRDETRSHRFERPGVAALGCNIHDQMVAFIRIVDTPWAAKTSATGEATLTDTPPVAGATLRVWHPYLRAPGNEVSRPLTAAGSVAVTVDIRPPAARGHH